MNSKFGARFGRRQKLKSRKQIQELFDGGNSFFAHPVKLIWMVGEPSTGPVASKLLTGVSVSKRNFKKATDRNRVKRLLRESYRLNKQALETAFETKTSSLLLFFNLR